jgi:hypothetical protein
MGWSEWDPSSRPQGSGVGQLVTDSRFSMADPFSYQVRSTGPDGSLPFFEEKPKIMLQSRGWQLDDVGAMTSAEDGSWSSIASRQTE